MKNMKSQSDKRMQARLIALACATVLFVATPMASLAQEKAHEVESARKVPAKPDSKKPVPAKDSAMDKNDASKKRESEPVFKMPDPCLKNSNLPGCELR
jgi:hypothetical protein